MYVTPWGRPEGASTEYTRLGPRPPCLSLLCYTSQAGIQARVLSGFLLLLLCATNPHFLPCKPGQPVLIEKRGEPQHVEPTPAQRQGAPRLPLPHPRAPTEVDHRHARADPHPRLDAPQALSDGAADADSSRSPCRQPPAHAFLLSLPLNAYPLLLHLKPAFSTIEQWGRSSRPRRLRLLLFRPRFPRRRLLLIIPPHPAAPSYPKPDPAASSEAVPPSHPTPNRFPTARCCPSVFTHRGWSVMVPVVRLDARHV